MKNIYILLGLATSILHTSCMEMQRPKTSKSCEDFTEISLDELNLQQTNTTYLCTANEPGWQKLNEIANMTYKRNPPIIQNPTDLTTIYRTNNVASTQKSINEQEKKPFLPKQIPLDSDAKIVQKLYADASRLTEYFGEKCLKRTALVRNSDLSVLIFNFNSNRSNTINEDTMGQFAYRKQSAFTPISIVTTLLFSCLKRYHLTIQNKPEDLPFTFNTQEKMNTISYNYLEQALGIADTNTPKNINITYAYLATFPAYLALADSFINIFSHTQETRNNFVSCLYSDEKTVFKTYPPITYDHLKNEFYNKAHNTLSNDTKNVTADDMYHLIQIIESAKSYRDIHNEKELGYGILSFETTRGILNWTTDYSIQTKNRVSILCQLIAEYNHASANKLTPTGKQYSCYRLKKDINAALPDFFTNKIFNENIYAFKAFKKLINATKALIEISDENVQLLVNKVYPQGK